MAEALAVLGAFSSALQVIECTTKVVSHTHDLLSSGDTTLRENNRLKKTATEYQELGRAASACVRGDAGAEEEQRPSDSEARDPTTYNSKQLAQEYDKLEAVLTRLKKAKANTEQERTIARLGRECEAASRELLEQLGALEIDPEAKGGKRLAKALKIAIKSLRKRKEIERSRENLRELNNQLATAIVQSLHAKQHDLSIAEGLRLPSIGLGYDGNVRKALLFVESERRHAILNSLRFAELPERSRSIREAYPATYEWALQNDTGLRKWLQQDNGIFWITGKAGSGKSTLMKFLYGHTKTKMLLRSWSGDRELVTANFYFWYAGTTLQKSQDGLLRTILYEILAEEQDLIQVAFPDRYESHGYDEARDSRPCEWTYKELVQGLKRLAFNQTSNTSQKKFCLFIDGMDEYAGNHLDLVSLLKDLVVNVNIKLCVSSRPWNAFRNTLGLTSPSLLLEELTKTDIYLYTNQRIAEALERCNSAQFPEDEDQVPTLVEEIVKKAEGVFLWVMLVVKFVISGLAEGDPISMLRYRVDKFPADLEEFFRSMLDRVDPVYKAQTCQALKLAFMFVQDEGLAQKLSTFVDFWLIAQSPQGIANARFPYFYGPQHVSAGKAWGMIARTRNMLCSACKDLLCIPKTATNDPLELKVTFLHRTVYDFLQDDTIQSFLNASVPKHFMSSQIFHLLNLARLSFNSQPEGHAGQDGALDNYDEILAMSSVSERYADTSAMSVTSESTHRHDGSVVYDSPVLSQEYVDLFAACCIYAYGRDKFLYVVIEKRELLCTFLAYPKSKVWLECLSLPDCRRWISSDGGPYWQAALGEHKIRRFGIDEVNIKVIECLRQMFPGEIKRGVGYGCYDSAFRLCLRKWYILVRQRRILRLSLHEQEKVYRRLWELSKALLPRGSRLDSGVTFCTSPSPGDDPDHVHRYCAAADFLRTELPESWLLERPETKTFVARREYHEPIDRHYYYPRDSYWERGPRRDYKENETSTQRQGDISCRKRQADSSDYYQNLRKRRWPVEQANLSSYRSFPYDR